MYQLMDGGYGESDLEDTRHWEGNLLCLMTDLLFSW